MAPSNGMLLSAFNKTMNILSKRGESLKSFSYTNEKIASELYSAMNSTEFLGISVRTKITKKLQKNLHS